MINHLRFSQTKFVTTAHRVEVLNFVRFPPTRGGRLSKSIIQYKPYQLRTILPSAPKVNVTS